MDIFKIFKQFSKERKIGDKQKTERIGERVDACLTPTLTLKEGDMKSFQRYFVFLPTR